VVQYLGRLGLQVSLSILPASIVASARPSLKLQSAIPQTHGWTEILLHVDNDQGGDKGAICPI